MLIICFKIVNYKMGKMGGIYIFLDVVFNLIFKCFLGEVNENERIGMLGGYTQVYGGVDQGTLLNWATK